MFTVKAAIVAALAVAAFAAALIVGNTLATIDQPGGTLVVLVGRSGSEGKSVRAVKACADAAIARAIETGATLYIAQVGPTSALDWTPIHTRLTGAARSNASEAAKQAKDRRDRARDELERVLATPPAKGHASDVFAAARAAGRLLGQEPGPHTLALCSDMHAVGSGLNLYKDNIAVKNCPALARRLGERWGDLRGVVVVAGAAGLDRRVDVSPGREVEIERFWKKCWAETVGAISPMRYDSVAHF